MIGIKEDVQRRMLNIERLNYILKELQERKSVYVNELSEKYYVSPSTIRRDLDQLEKEGLIRRTYGGCVLIERQNAEIPLQLRNNEQSTEKDMIASLAAKLIQDGMFIFLDSTSTSAHLVKFLANHRDLKILTTSAQTALNCLDHVPAQIYCTGGWMSTYSRGFCGESARSRIEEFYTDISFFSVRGITFERGIADVNEDDVFLKQTILKNCRKSVLLCDSKKFGIISYRTVCDFSKIDYLITDKQPDNDWMEVLEKSNVKVIYPKV